MHLPNLKPRPGMLQSQDLFFGLNRNLRLGPGEFYDMENLTSDRFPVLSPRNPRGILKEGGDIRAIAGKEGFCYVEGRELFLNGKKTNLRLEDLPGPRQLVSMGAYLIVLPDRKYLNTASPGDWGSIDAEVTTAAPVQLFICNQEGEEIRPDYTFQPEKPQDKSYWLDWDSQELKQYSEVTGLWSVITSPCVKLQCSGIGKGFRASDGIAVSGDPGLKELAGTAVIESCGQDYVVIPGLIREPVTLHKPVTLSRKMPKLDYCIESGNRLWGCRYGLSSDGQVVNEIYCSKLGDFRNWSCYMGISTDSYAVSLGSDGPFTGAITYGGHPLFFKEDCIHKVFGQMPSNFQVQTTPCRGVEKGSSGSLAIVREQVYYKSPEGICVYDGSLPREISRNLGPGAYHNAVGAGAWELLVYDTEKDLWHREDGLQAKAMCRCQDSLICLDGQGRLLDLLGKTGRKETERVSWSAETGIIGVTLPGCKYLGKLELRMLLDPGSQVSVLVQYDSMGPWEDLGTVQGMYLRSFRFPVLPRRCDHLRLRLKGQGRALVFSLTRTLRNAGNTG